MERPFTAFGKVGYDRSREGATLDVFQLESGAARKPVPIGTKQNSQDELQSSLEFRYQYLHSI